MQAIIDSHQAPQIVRGVGLISLTLLLVYVSLKGDLPLFLMGVLGGVGAFLLIWKPHVGVLTLLIFWLLQRSPMFAGLRQLNGPYLIGMVLTIPLALSIIRERRVWVWQVPQIKIFLGIAALFLVSTWWSDLRYPVTLMPELDETAAWMRAFVTLLGFLIFFIYFINTRQRVELIVWFLLGLIAFTALSALLPFLQGEEIKRASASFGIAENSNRFAYMCIFGVSLLWFYHSYGPGGWFKRLVFPLLFFLTAAALSSGSRSGFLQLMILAVFVIKDQKGWSLAKRIQGTLLLGSIILVLVAVVPAAQISRATSYTSGAKVAGGKSLRDRTRTLYAVAQLTASNPILGIGLGNFIWMHKTLNGFENATHNSYLWMLVEGGIGVLALYLFLFHITYRMLAHLERAGPPEWLWLSKGLKVNLILFLVFSIFANFWISIFVYLIVGLTIVMTRVWQNRIQDFAMAPQALSFR